MRRLADIRDGARYAIQQLNKHATPPLTFREMLYLYRCKRTGANCYIRCKATYFYTN